MVQQTENISQPFKKIRILWVVVIIILNVMIISGTLFAGLWPFNFLPANGCRADSKTGTLLFEKTGIAYRKMISSARQSLINGNTFSLAFRVQPFSVPVHCPTILGLYNSKEMIATINQWKSTLIVQSGSGKVVFGNVMNDQQPVSVIMTIADTILTVTCNGMTRNLSILYSDMKSRMLHHIVFGNNESLHSPWKGELSSIRFNKNVDAFEFIVVPKQLVPLKAKMLTPPWDDFRMEWRYALDMIVNLLGFIPLGISLSLLLSCVFSFRRYRYLVCILCFLTSLLIETSQAYLITRTSQMSDLILNSWGGVLGVVVYVILRRLILYLKVIDRGDTSKP